MDLLREKVANWLEKNKEKFWFSFILNSIALALIIRIAIPSFELNDDAIMQGLVNGAWGTKDAHLVFQNYLLGIILKILYTVGGTTIPWYSILQYFVLLISFSTLSYVLIRRLKNAQMLLVSGIILIYFGYESYIHIQFTKTAAIATCVGLFLLFHTITQEKISRKHYIAGMGLILLGFCYRDDEALPCFALMLGIGIYLLVELRELEKSERVHKLKVYFGSFFIVLALMLGATLFDQMMYQTEEWKAYLEYNDTRSRLIDYGVPDYDAHEAEYQALGITRSAYEMFSNWNFADPDIFPLETMQKVLEMKENKEIAISTFKACIYYLWVGFFEQKAFYPLLLLMIFWLFWSKHDLKSWLSALYTGLVFLAFYFYLYYVGRFLSNRVDVGLCFATSLVFVWMYTREKNKISLQGSLMGCMCLLVLIQLRWCLEWRERIEEHQNIVDEWVEEMVVEIENHSDCFYFSKVGALPLGIIPSLPEGSLNRVNWLGGWIVNLPQYRNMLEMNDITNPYEYMLENDNVYLIDDDMGLTLEYIHDYYDVGASYEFIKQIGPYCIFKLIGE